MRSGLKRFVSTFVFAVAIGILIPVGAYAIGCLVFLAKHPVVVGRFYLAMRNSAITVAALVLILLLVKLIHRHIGRLWFWIPVACLGGLAACGTAIIYFVASVELGSFASVQEASSIADRLRLQTGRHLVVPKDISGLELRYRNANAERIVLNDHLAQPLFGINLPKLWWGEDAGGDVEITFAADSIVTGVKTTRPSEAYSEWGEMLS